VDVVVLRSPTRSRVSRMRDQERAVPLGRVMDPDTCHAALSLT
jgi:hypothetical protein